MDTHYPTIDKPATPEYVLAVLRDEHRQMRRLGDSPAPYMSLSLDSTVAEWRLARDLVGSRQLGRAMNQSWGISCTDAEWQAVLEPPKTKRLAGVCELIALHARRPLIRPSRLFGCTCSPAGAFLTIRSLLHQAGVPADDIAPSTPLAPYLRRHLALFLGPISRLAPGALPLVRVRAILYEAASCALVAGALCLVVGPCIGLPLLTARGGFLFVLAYSLIWIAKRLILPASVEFGRLRTFRDLALVIAEGNPAEPDAASGGSIPG